jgi:hypothetical protein
VYRTSTQPFNIIAEKEGKILLDFGDEKYSIKKKYLRAKRCIIYKLPNGKIKVQNPDNWKNQTSTRCFPNNFRC